MALNNNRNGASTIPTGDRPPPGFSGTLLYHAPTDTEIRRNGLILKRSTLNSPTVVTPPHPAMNETNIELLDVFSGVKIQHLFDNYDFS